MDFYNRTVCVTGGASGLGLEITRALLAQLAIVVVIDCIEQPIIHKNLTYYQIDLSKERPILDTKFDVFISNLGTSVGSKSFDEMTMEEIELMLLLNVSIQLHFLKRMEYKKFVFINSILSFHGVPQYSMYCAVKAFIRTLNESLVMEGKDTLIVYPYKINTQLFKEVRDIFTLDAKYVAKRVLRDISKHHTEDFIPSPIKYADKLLYLLPTFLRNVIVSWITKWMIVKSNAKIE